MLIQYLKKLHCFANNTLQLAYFVDNKQVISLAFLFSRDVENDKQINHKKYNYEEFKIFIYNAFVVVWHCC